MSDEHLEKQIKTTLDRSVEQLDADTLGRLRRARAAALTAAESKQPFSWLPLVSSASLAMVVVAVILMVLPKEPGLSAGLDDLEMFSAADDLELYQEMDFYTWLAEEDAHGAAG